MRQFMWNYLENATIFGGVVGPNELGTKYICHPCFHSDDDDDDDSDDGYDGSNEGDSDRDDESDHDNASWWW